MWTIKNQNINTEDLLGKDQQIHLGGNSDGRIRTDSGNEPDNHNGGETLNTSRDKWPCSFVYIYDLRFQEVSSLHSCAVVLDASYTEAAKH